MKGIKQPAPERFAEKFQVNAEGCWEWQAGRNASGYGTFTPTPGRKMYAHRYAYELCEGPIPEGLQLDHLCRNPACVNPDHLEAVTPRVNLLRGNTAVRAAQESTSCINGHPWSTSNTYIRPDNGRRVCRACRAARMRRYNRNLIAQ